MTLGNHICSFDQAKRIAKLGFDFGETIWCWFSSDAINYQPFLVYSLRGKGGYWSMPTYTVSELGLLLPYNDVSVYIDRDDGLFWADAEAFDSDENLIDNNVIGGFTTEVEVLGEVLIWMGTNRYLDLRKRL